jgi:hypothetical protein
MKVDLRLDKVAIGLVPGLRGWKPRMMTSPIGDEVQ